MTRGSKIERALSLQKTAIDLRLGEAAAFNNRGATKFLLGDDDGAQADTDKAATLDASASAPWLNGALIALDHDKPDLAQKDAQTAIAQGQKNALANAILSEADFKLGQLDRAEDDYKEAFRFDSSNPYALLVKAKIDQARGHRRDAERALAQALTSGPQAAVDSKLTPRFGQGDALAGSTDEAHANVLEHAFHISSAVRFNGLFDQQLIEERHNGKQRSGQAELTGSNTFATLYGFHINSNGGRPGAVSDIADLTPSPDNRFRFTETTALLLKPIQTGARSTLWLHANYRTAQGLEKTDAANPWLSNLKDVQWMEEFRWDTNISPESLIQVGATYSTLKRSGNGQHPIDPAEQLLGNGTTHLWNAYGINRRPVLRNASLVWGLMAGGAAGNKQLQPLVDVGFLAPSQHTVHFRITPRFNDAISDLIPVDIVAASAQNNPLDRNEFSTTAFDRNPTLQNAKSKQLDFELALTTADSPFFKSETVVFHRTLNDVDSQGADPRLTTALVLTPVQEAQSTGIEQKITKNLSPSTTLRVVARFQETHADFQDTTYDLSQYPTLVEKNGHQLPNFPRYQAVASLDYALHDWTASLIGVYFGQRTTSITRTISGSPRTFLSTAKAGANAHIVINRKLSHESNALLDVFNIGNANFYPGYPGKTTFVLGFNYRF